MSTDNLNPYIFASQMIDRTFVSYLSPCEFLVLRFILNRTLARGKEWEVIPARHFIEGVFEDDGKTIVFGGLNMSRRTLITCLKSLEVSEIVRIQKVRPHPKYAISTRLVLADE